MFTPTKQIPGNSVCVCFFVCFKKTGCALVRVSVNIVFSDFFFILFPLVDLPYA